ncbi:MAG TPA: hypothetical protein VFA26_02250 [Gemmataceae bacterium]|nr:hypothetical protein [Gemmataceae bacterium]
MNFFQIDVSAAPAPAPAEAPAVPLSDTADLLRQMLDVQREQLAQLRASAAAHDASGRWRAFLSRWQDDFPDLPAACKKALPHLERAYGKLIADLADNLAQEGNDALDNDFALQEFLDRYGMRLAQLGAILSLVAPLAEAGHQGESA